MFFLGRKTKKSKKERIEFNNKIKKYEVGFELLDNLLKLSSNDNSIYSKLNFDFSDITPKTNLNGKGPNASRVLGMLTVFKFFKPFIESSFHSMNVQERIIQKIAELNSQINCMEVIYRNQE